MNEALRQRAIEGLRQIVDEEARATDVVTALARAAANNDERAFLKNTLFSHAVMRLRRRFVFGDDVATWVDAVEPASIAWPQDPLERLAVSGSCPLWLARHLVDSFGFEGAAAFLAASNKPGPVVLRANRLMNSAAELVGLLKDEGIDAVVFDDAIAADIAPDAVVVRGRANLMGSQAWRAGRFELQDAGSQCVASRCGVAAGDVVVDFCAGRGGKTLALAALMGDRGALHVNDTNAAALADLRGRVRRLQLRCVVESLPAPQSADVVLVDAPCTSLGVLRRSPDLRFTLCEADIEGCRVVQRQVLQEASRLVRPGGRLVYATCSVLRAENDDIVDAFIADAGADFVEVSREMLAPHTQRTDGFFIAVMIHIGSSSSD